MICRHGFNSRGFHQCVSQLGASGPSLWPIVSAIQLGNDQA